MTAFSTVTPTPAPLDPCKHVNYTLGMVLGVDDFGQEFAYHAGRDMWLARDLMGCGTVRGLDVSIQSAASSTPTPSTVTEVLVQPGVALTPQGQIVRVPSAQCAVLDTWIQDNQTTIANLFGSPSGSAQSGSVSLYVVLSYKPSLTDRVPIPGEPCRSTDDAMAPSRVTDGFSLDLSVTPPAPTEEPGMQAVLGWLAQVPISSGPGSGDVIAAMKTCFGLTGSPPPPPPVLLPPSPPPPGLTIGASTATSTYRAALQLYATTLRNLIAGSLKGDPVPSGLGIQLAKVTFPVTQTLRGVWTLNGNVAVDTTRPFLLPLDMLKEAWIANAASLARYRVVSAGALTIAASGSPATGRLQAVWSGGEVNVSFPDVPEPGTQYVVKALPYVATSPAGTPPNVNLVVTSITTNPPGFSLGVFLNGAAVHSAASAPGLSLLVEVVAVSGS